MARQNFSGGGFIGKLGVHVGQRWHDTFVVRTWVRTPNPNTPAQKSHRQKFGLASSLASYAINANRFCGLFPVKIEGEHGSRLKCAYQKIDAGLEGLSLYPLFPIDYTPVYTLSHCYLKSVSSSEIVFVVDGVLPATSRAMSALIALPATATDPAEDVITSGHLEINGTSAVLTVANAWGDRVEIGQKIVLISNDDPTHDAETVWLPESEILEIPKPTRAFNLNVYSFTRANRTFTLVFEELYMAGSQTLSGVVVRCVYSGIWGEFTLENTEFQNVDGRFALTFTASGSTAFDNWAFPAGSSISFGKIQVFGDDVNLISEDVSQALISTDLLRLQIVPLSNATICYAQIEIVDYGDDFNIDGLIEITVAVSGVWTKAYTDIDHDAETFDDHTTLSGNIASGERYFRQGGRDYTLAEAVRFEKADVRLEESGNITTTISFSALVNGTPTAYGHGTLYAIQNPLRLTFQANGVNYGYEIDFNGYEF